MRTSRLIILTTIAIAGLALLGLLPASVPVVQGQGSLGPTATPDAEGVIYAIVQEGDSFWTIAARHGLTLDEIYELNDAEEGDFVQVGQRLIVGYGQEPTPDGGEGTEEAATPEGETGESAEGEDPGGEAEADATATPLPPTPSPPARGGEICLSAFLDDNQNGQRDPGEELKSAVAFTITNGEAVVSNYVTDGVSEPYCITGLDNDDYRVTRSAARGEVLTTPGEWAVSLVDETSQTVEFGSFFEEESALTPEEGSEMLDSAEDSAADPAADEEGSITGIIVIAAVVISVLLLVGVLVIVLSVRRSTV